MQDNTHPDTIYEKMDLSDRISKLQFRNLTRNIKYGYSWTDISKNFKVSNFDPISHKPNKSKLGLTNEQILEIYKLSHQMSARKVGEMFNVSDSVVYNIKNKKRYTKLLNDHNLLNMSSTTIEN